MSQRPSYNIPVDHETPCYLQPSSCQRHPRTNCSMMRLCSSPWFIVYLPETSKQSRILVCPYFVVRAELKTRHDHFETSTRFDIFHSCPDMTKGLSAIAPEKTAVYLTTLLNYGQNVRHVFYVSMASMMPRSAWLNKASITRCSMDMIAHN